MIKDINKIIRQWLFEAAQICRDFPSESLEVFEKSPGHKVTNLDYKIDEFLKKQIFEYYPDHNIISEEGEQYFNPSKPYTWLLDPIDGTTYLIKGSKEYSVVIMLLYNGKPLVTGIINPETRAYWIATDDGIEVDLGQINQFDYQDRLLTSPNFICKKNVPSKNISHVGSIANRICLAVSCSGIGAVSVQNLALWDVLPGMFYAQKNGYDVVDMNGNSIGYDIEDLTLETRGLIVFKKGRLAAIESMIGYRN